MFHKAAHHGTILRYNTQVRSIVEPEMRFIDVEGEQRGVFGVLAQNLLRSGRKVVGSQLLSNLLLKQLLVRQTGAICTRLKLLLECESLLRC